MIKMEKSQIIKELNQVIVRYKKLSVEWEALSNVLDVGCESPFAHSIWTLFDEYCSLMSEKLGDQNNWISYYLFECDCGNKKMEVSINGKKTKLDKVTKLADLIISDHDN
jgi:hypothetical protein